MDKHKIIELVCRQLQADLQIYFRAAHAARFEATHEQSKPENKYDTRGLEASYLARGQSRQAQETQAALSAFEQLGTQLYSGNKPIDISDLVELQSASGFERMLVFIGPSAGGTEVELDGQEVVVVTPSSPIGSQIVGQLSGHQVRLPGAAPENHWTIARIW
ncbi:MAG: transcription elongation factor GreAB [Verrucomicrobia bacterium]|nr:transcription elongation factor GreAB [Verrucomicrobiota bacterium]